MPLPVHWIQGSVPVVEGYGSAYVLAEDGLEQYIDERSLTLASEYGIE